MSKLKNPSKSAPVEDDGEFRISTTRIGKDTLVTVTFQLTELQEAHLARIATSKGTTRAEFCKQAVNYCLKRMGEPLPQNGVADEETLEALEQRRAKRAERREKMNNG